MTLAKFGEGKPYFKNTPINHKDPIMRKNILAILGRTCLVVTFTFTLMASRIVFAAGGDLDPTFNSTGNPPGTVRTFIAPQMFTGAMAWGVSVRPDGAIITCGASELEWAVVAYDGTNGSLDTGFGGGGIVTEFAGQFGAAKDVAIRPDNRTVVGGWGVSGLVGEYLMLIQYHPDGTRDTSFGSGGQAGYSGSSGLASSFINALAIQDDGKIVVAGVAHDPWDAAGGGVVIRYDSDGQLDAGFGNGGAVFVAASGLGPLQDIAIQPDGRIVVVGSGPLGLGSFSIGRLDANGNFDPTFGVGGVVTTDLGASSSAYSVALQPDGKIVAGGTGSVGGSTMPLARYESDGSLDMTFGVSGIATPDFSGGSAREILITANGKIIAAAQGLAEFALVAFDSNGQLDTTFGVGGTVRTTILDGGNYITSAALQVDDKIVAAGRALDAPNSSMAFAAARYFAGGPADPLTSAMAKVDALLLDPSTPTAVRAPLNAARTRLDKGEQKLALVPADEVASLSQIRQALAKLDKAIRKGLDPATIVSTMDDLSGFARVFANDAINAAITAGGDPTKIARAQEYLADGDTWRSAGEFEKSVREYKSALQKALSA